MALRKIKEKDLKLVLSWRNHPSIRNSMFNQNIISLNDHKAWFSREEQRESSCWLIYSDDAGQDQGVVYCTSIDIENKHAFWGFYTAPEAVKGTGTNMCSEALDYFFSEFSLRKISAEVIESNKRSHLFHKKLGFSVEGEFKEHSKNNYGYESVTRYALFSYDWSK